MIASSFVLARFLQCFNNADWQEAVVASRQRTTCWDSDNFTKVIAVVFSSVIDRSVRLCVFSQQRNMTVGMLSTKGNVPRVQRARCYRGRRATDRIFCRQNGSNTHQITSQKLVDGRSTKAPPSRLDYAL